MAFGLVLATLSLVTQASYFNAIVGKFRPLIHKIVTYQPSLVSYEKAKLAAANKVFKTEYAAEHDKHICGSIESRMKKETGGTFRLTGDFNCKKYMRVTGYWDEVNAQTKKAYLNVLAKCSQPNCCSYQATLSFKNEFYDIRPVTKREIFDAYKDNLRKKLR